MILGDCIIVGVPSIVSKAKLSKDMTYYSRDKEKSLQVVKVINNNPAVIVFFNDGSKTVAKCDKEDTFSLETGISICLLKKILGNKGFHQAINGISKMAENNG